MNGQRIIIAGGGICGLMAARILAGKFQVTIIEYRNILGGRIRSLPLAGAAGCIEAGAEFVHGNLPITLSLLKEAGLEYVKAGGKMLRREGNRWKEEEEMVEEWDKLLALMKKQDPGITMQEFLDENFPGDKNAKFRQHVKQFVQGFDVAEPARVSVKALYKEWEAEEDNYRIVQGYSALTRFLENDCIKKGCRIITGKAVKQIDWKKDNITAHTSDGERYTSEKILVTIPVSVLQKHTGLCSISFNPSIDNYISSSLQIGFGTVIKIVLEFNKPIWQEKTGFILSDAAIPTWWTQYPLNNNLFTGWIGGPMAEKIAHHTDEELLQMAISSIAQIFDLSQSDVRNNLKQSFVFNWNNYGESIGAYSYTTPSSPAARQLLNTPLEDSLFFAGEGLYEGNRPGTVEAALTSGKSAAEKIISSAGIP